MRPSMNKMKTERIRCHFGRIRLILRRLRRCEKQMSDDPIVDLEDLLYDEDSGRPSER